MGALWQVCVIFGLHWGLVPLMINNMTVLGHDSMLPIMLPAVIARWAPRWGFSCHPRCAPKVLAGSAVSAGMFGITEPAIYGLTCRCAVRLSSAVSPAPSAGRSRL
jgi:PTS system beta-glucosides-specific IIC component